jgi:hypothetical protein
LQLQFDTLKLQAAELQNGGQLVEANSAGMGSEQVDPPNALAVLGEEQQHIIHLLLFGYGSRDALQRVQSCLVQSAMGSGSTEQAALVGCCTAPQDC